MLLIPAHAKVNLCLAVRGPRPDGFHDINSVVVGIDWHDLVGIELHASEITSVRLRVARGARDLPPDDSNLAVLAGRAVAAVAGPLDIELWLDKRIPSAAGLGGGSTDAAAVLRGCASLLGDGRFAADRAAALDRASLHDLGAGLGSDVPVLISGGAQRARGRGELVRALDNPPLHLAVAVAASSSTAATYAAVQRFDHENSSRVDAVAAALKSGARPDDDLLGSGLEPAACRANPELGERLLALRAAVSEARWHLTGSGGAAFALADDHAHAGDLAAAAGAAGFPARACRTVAG